MSSLENFDTKIYPSTLSKSNKMFVGVFSYVLSLSDLATFSEDPHQFSFSSSRTHKIVPQNSKFAFRLSYKTHHDQPPFINEPSRSCCHHRAHEQPAEALAHGWKRWPCFCCFGVQQGRCLFIGLSDSRHELQNEATRGANLIKFCKHEHDDGDVTHSYRSSIAIIVVDPK